MRKLVFSPSLCVREDFFGFGETLGRSRVSLSPRQRRRLFIGAASADAAASRRSDATKHLQIFISHKRPTETQTQQIYSQGNNPPPPRDEAGGGLGSKVTLAHSTTRTYSVLTVPIQTLATHQEEPSGQQYSQYPGQPGNRATGAQLPIKVRAGDGSFQERRRLSEIRMTVPFTVPLHRISPCTR